MSGKEKKCLLTKYLKQECSLKHMCHLLKQVHTKYGGQTDGQTEEGEDIPVCLPACANNTKR